MWRAVSPGAEEMVVGVEVGVGEKGLLGQSARAWALTVELNLDPPWQAQISNSRRFDSFGLYYFIQQSHFVMHLLELAFRL